jgi:hypothetical protein
MMTNYFNTNSFIGNKVPPFAYIYYLQNGEIGKFRIINWYGNHEHYVALGKLINNQLTLHRIETHDSEGKKVIVFDLKG